MKTILVVDDAAIIREMLKAVLEAEGYTVLLAEDGEEAISIYKEHQVDLSIVDIFLPKKGGLETIGELAKLDKSHKTIVISGGESFNPEKVLQLAGIFEVAETFTKPVDTEKLVARVNELLA